MSRAPARGPALRYATAWLAAAAITAGVAVVFLGSPSSKEPAGMAGMLPPVGQIRLERAARVARCDLRRGDRAARANPPADGRAQRRAPRPGRYTRPLSAAALIAALRRGIIVIQHRPRISERTAERLAALQAALPRGTIVVPNATGMPYAVAVTAWRRVLGCPSLSGSAVDAMRLFRGRFVGTVPGH